MAEKKIILFLKAVSFFFVIAAVVHLMQIISPWAGDPSGPARHMAFVSIDITTAVLLWIRPFFLKYLFTILTLQQLSTHGVKAWNGLVDSGQILYVDWLIAIFMPIICVILWRLKEASISQKSEITN